MNSNSNEEKAVNTKVYTVWRIKYQEFNVVNGNQKQL